MSLLHLPNRSITPSLCVPAATLLALIVLALGGAPSLADATTDCFADRVVAYRVGTVSAPPATNSWQPGIVLGPPGDATPMTGSLSVMSLGHGGQIVLEFVDNVVVDGPGPDFILFENPFFCSAVPLTSSDSWSVNAEPGIVEVSEDGIDYRMFPYDAAALSQVVNLCSDMSLVQRLGGLMGLTPNFSGNYTVADDPLVFDTAAPAGISGHGGDAFDLATVGLSRARFVRITDPNLPIGIPGPSDGLDVDAAVALHSLPLLGPAEIDSDHDGLSDEAERYLYLTNPDDPDSDGDGISDGEEAATCHSPLAPGSQAPFFLPIVSLEISDPSPTLLRWNFLGTGLTYDAIRGDVGALRSAGGLVDLGVVTCIENNSTDLTTRGLADAALPSPGNAFFYDVRVNLASGGFGYGLSSAHEPRVPSSGDCPQ
jgi:Bacterial TSP3 repeat